VLGDLRTSRKTEGAGGDDEDDVEEMESDGGW